MTTQAANPSPSPDPNPDQAATLLLVFNFVALLIYWWPGPTEHGPVTIHGHTPEYSDNGVAHCILFTLRYPEL